MYAHTFRLLFLYTLLSCSTQLSLPTDISYHAGVVEFTARTGPTGDDLNAATKSFINIIESQETADLDILVFPEYVLNTRDYATFVPHPAKNITPCYQPDFDIFLVELSCATRARGIYVVVNVVEKELCAKGAGSDTLNPCPANGVRYFNTNVVFDRTGRVISRYRKTHLWRGEYNSHAVLRQPDVAIFETDFGVTFGHFICFDMLFYEPAMRLLLEHNVTDIIYPTYWFSELPFLGAVQLQEGWAFGNDINLLAADASQPSGKTSGSGIYAGRLGRLNAAIFEEPTRKLLKARVPKRSLNGSFELPPDIVPAFQPQLITKRYTKLATYRDYNVDIFSTLLLPEQFLNVSERVCHGSFCCDFSVQRALIGISSDYAAYRYRLAAYLGNETSFIRVDRSEQALCAIFACPNEQLLSCGRIHDDGVSVANQHYFQHISISGNFPAAPRRLIIPSTLDGVMMPLSVTQYAWTESPPARELKDTRVQLELVSPKNDLLTFAIWANYFTEIPSSHNLDHLQSPGGKSDASAAVSSVWTLSLLLFAYLLNFFK